MAHFYGTLQGSRGQASRLGTANSGLTVKAASWSGAVRTDLSVRDGVDWVTVSLVPHHGKGTTRVLYDGPVSGNLAEAGLAKTYPTVWSTVWPGV